MQKRLLITCDRLGYAPKMFNSYHAKELTDTDKAPTQTTNCGHMGNSADVLIFEKE